MEGGDCQAGRASWRRCYPSCFRMVCHVDQHPWCVSHRSRCVESRQLGSSAGSSASPGGWEQLSAPRLALGSPRECKVLNPQPFHWEKQSQDEGLLRLGGADPHLEARLAISRGVVGTSG